MWISEEPEKYLLPRCIYLVNFAELGGPRRESQEWVWRSVVFIIPAHISLPINCIEVKTCF